MSIMKDYNNKKINVMNFESKQNEFKKIKYDLLNLNF